MIFLAAVLPVIFLLYFIYKKDTEKEPVSLLFKCFGLGMLIVIPVVVVETIVSILIDSTVSEGTIHNFLTAFFVAGMVEEGFKLLAILWILRKNKYFDQHYDGIVYAVFISLGFALVENIGYVSQTGMGVAIYRGIITVPAHALFAVFMGFYVSKRQFSISKNRKKFLLLALLIPMVLHGLFDFFLMDMSYFAESKSGILLPYLLLFFGLNIWMWRNGLKRIRQYITIDRQEIDNKNDSDIEVV